MMKSSRGVQGKHEIKLLSRYRSVVASFLSGVVSKIKQIVSMIN